MRAVVYRKPFEVAVEEVPDPRIEQPNDVIVRITSACICGHGTWAYPPANSRSSGRRTKRDCCAAWRVFPRYCCSRRW